MVNAWLGLSLEKLLRVQSEIPYEKFQQSKLKTAYTVNNYSCYTYVNNQTKFIETRLNCKQISLIVVILDKNGGDCIEKNYVSIIRFCGY